MTEKQIQGKWFGFEINRVQIREVQLNYYLW